MANGSKINIIYMALALLKKQFPNMEGLHDSLYGADLSFPKSSHPFVQILNLNNTHWVTIASSSPTTVRFYDSLYPSISSLTKVQVAAVMRCSDRRITIIRHKTQFQKGGSDCGLFAIAYAMFWTRTSWHSIQSASYENSSFRLPIQEKLESIPIK